MFYDLRDSIEVSPWRCSGDLGSILASRENRKPRRGLKIKSKKEAPGTRDGAGEPCLEDLVGHGEDHRRGRGHISHMWTPRLRSYRRSRAYLAFAFDCFLARKMLCGQAAMLGPG